MDAENTLTSEEISLLKAIAENVDLPSSKVALYLVKRHADQQNGLSNTGFNVAFRSLTKKDFIKITDEEDESGPRSYLEITENGWVWIEKHKADFGLRSDTIDDAIPF
jgi:hypothetical protein